MADAQVCCFCLGGVTDIPSFGELKDGEDFISPCATCSIQCHRKCLIDWYTALPSDKIQIVDPQRIHETLLSQENTDSADNTTYIHLDFSAGAIRDWISNNVFGQSEQTDQTGTNTSADDTNSNTNRIETSGVYHTNHSRPVSPLVFIFAPCPQCKSHIIFTMKRSSVLSMNLSTSHLIVRSIQYGGIFLGVTSAITGIITMGYVGLTSCGLKMMECLIPGSLLVSMLTKRSPHNFPATSTYNTLSQLLLGNVNNHGIDNLEQALYKGLIDPLKFSRIPVLPIMLYRMRSSSISSCLFEQSKDSKIGTWITEFLISGYISSLGNHELIRKLSRNLGYIAAEIAKDPHKLRTLLSTASIFNGINFWKASNMISMLVPIRWMYDIFSRVVINKIHFDIILGVRPREITNSLPPNDIDNLEELNDKLKNVEREIKNERARISLKLQELQSKSPAPPPTKMFRYMVLVVRAIFKSNIPLRYAKLKFTNYLYKLKACMVHDYTNALLSKSVMVRAFTTIVWPYFASKVGLLVYHMIKPGFGPQFSHEKIVLVSNMVGLVAVVFIKDLYNFYMSYKTAKQLSKMNILTSLYLKKKLKKSNTNPDPNNYSYLFSTNTSDEENISGEETDQYDDFEEFQDSTSFPGGYPVL